jgi:hypothetical protein
MPYVPILNIPDVKMLLILKIWYIPILATLIEDLCVSIC